MIRKTIPKKYERYITPTKDGKYYRIRYKHYNTTKKTIDQCIALIHKADEEESKGKKIDISNKHVTLEIAMNDWINRYVLADPTLRESSKQRKIQAVKEQIIANIGYLEYQSITKLDVIELINSLRNGNNESNKKYSESTVKKAYEYLRQFYNQTGYIDYIDNDVFRNRIKFQIETNTHSAFSMEEKKKIEEATGLMSEGFKNVKLRLAPCLVLLLHTGIREGELLALTWDDVVEIQDGYALCIHSSARYIKNSTSKKARLVIGQTKNKKSRFVPLDKPALLAIKYFRTINGNAKYVCANASGQVPHDSTIRKTFQQILETASINNEKLSAANRYKYNVHSLRHTFATILINDCNAEVAKVSQLLGHSDISTTMKYYVKNESEKFLDTVSLLE